MCITYARMHYVCTYIRIHEIRMCFCTCVCMYIRVHGCVGGEGVVGGWVFGVVDEGACLVCVVSGVVVVVVVCV